MADKKVYPFNYRAFAFHIKGEMAQGCTREPGFFVTPAKKGVNLQVQFNHPSVPGTWYHAMSFDSAYRLVNKIRELALAPKGTKIISQFAFRFFKGGGFTRDGVIVGLVREESGRIFISFKDKAVPAVRFPFVATDMVELDKDGNELSDADASPGEALAWCERVKVMIKEAQRDAIEPAEPQSGGWNQNNNNNQSQQQAPAPQAPGGDGGGFDDDIPF